MPAITASAVTIQQESVNPSKPTSEFLNFSMGGSINFLLNRVFPVGSLVSSMLSESDFQNQIGNPNPHTWILADGRNVSGSTYSEVTGQTFAPDLRGIFIRGQDAGRGLNPDGNLPLGSYEADQFASHNHAFSDPGHSHGLNQAVNFLSNIYQSGSTLSAFDQSGFTSGLNIDVSGTGITFNAQGGNETRIRNVTINWMVRIN